MKRFNNKTLTAERLYYHPNTISLFHWPETKQKVWLRFLADPRAFKSSIFLKMDFIELPTLDVYEIKANAKDGAVIGYAFDATAKNVNHTHNFLVSCNSEFRSSSIKDLNKNSFEMKYRINGMHLYEYEGMASMVTVGLPEKIRESMELL